MSNYTIQIDATGENLDDMIAAIEMLLEHRLAPLTDASDLDDKVAAEGGEIVYELVRGDVRAAAVLSDAVALDFGLDDETQELAALPLPL